MSYTIKVVTPPTEEPVTLEDAQDHLGASGDTLLIEAQIVAARQAAEAFTRRAFTTHTLELVLDAFPRGRRGRAPWWLDTAFSFANAVELPRPPLVSVDSIVTLDYDGNQSTISDSLYFVNTRSEPGSIVPRQLQSWPTNVLPEAGVVITFTAGYGAPADVPQAIKQAILLEVAAMYNHRDPSIESETIDNASTKYARATGGMTEAAKALLAPYRVLRL